MTCDRMVLDAFNEDCLESWKAVGAVFRYFERGGDSVGVCPYSGVGGAVSLVSPHPLLDRPIRNDIRPAGTTGTTSLDPECPNPAGRGNPLTRLTTFRPRYQ